MLHEKFVVVWFYWTSGVEVCLIDDCRKLLKLCPKLLKQKMNENAKCYDEELACNLGCVAVAAQILKVNIHFNFVWKPTIGFATLKTALSWLWSYLNGNVNGRAGIYGEISFASIRQRIIKTFRCQQLTALHIIWLRCVAESGIYFKLNVVLKQANHTHIVYLGCSTCRETQTIICDWYRLWMRITPPER